MKVTVSRKAHFNAAHKLYRPDWTDDKNYELKDKEAQPDNQNLDPKNFQIV